MKERFSPSEVAQLVECLAGALKGYWFNSPPGHMPEL